MTQYNQESVQVQKLLDAANNIVIIQADNPDGDSLASSIALEETLSDMGKTVSLYCGVDIPSYLTYLPGWDRVDNELPKDFDLSIIVDTSSETLLEQLQKTNQLVRLKSKPCLVLDHHDGQQEINFATLSVNVPTVATGELIYELASLLSWPLNHRALTMIATSIMADSRGLTSDKTTARSIHIIGELVDKGVSIPEMETARRKTMSKSQELIRYKGVLLQRIKYSDDGRIAYVTIPWEEIETYSNAYNPTMLIMEDMLLTEGVQLAIGFKTYRGTRMTAKIRANFHAPIAQELAETFGGGGHPYASGFKVDDGSSFESITVRCLQKAQELLDNNNENEA